MSVAAISSTMSTSPIGPLPAGVAAPKTEPEKALYEACKQFEAVFVRQLVSGWMKSARGESAADGVQAVYQDMADSTMTQNLVEGGIFGLAGTVYGQLRAVAGPVTPTADPPPGVTPTLPVVA